MLNYFTKIPKQTIELNKNDEIIELKKALDTIQDNELINTNIELAFKYCVVLSPSSSSLSNSVINNENKYKRELAVQILELLLKSNLKYDQSKIITYLNQVIYFIFYKLNITTSLFRLILKEFFDRLMKLFETSNESYVLNLVQIIINLVGKVIIF